MRRARFVEERSAGWAELEGLLDRAKGRPERLGPDGVRRLGALYRGAAADLGFARRAFPGDPLIGPPARAGGPRAAGRLRERAAACVRPGVPVARATGSGSASGRGCWRSPRCCCSGRPSLGWVWGLNDPSAAYGVVPEQFRNRGGEPAAGNLSLSDEAGFAGQIFTNNIRVTFLAVAAGITLGIGTAVLAIYNGLLVGALGGISHYDGSGQQFLTLVVPHGVLELSLIIVSIVAGLRIGWALVEPGRMTRVESLRAQARPAMELVLGTMPWLVLAGLVEGFFTGSGADVRPVDDRRRRARRGVLGARPQSRARDFSRRYALTHARQAGRLDRPGAGALAAARPRGRGRSSTSTAAAVA